MVTTMARTPAAYVVAACGLVFGFDWMIQHTQLLTRPPPEDEFGRPDLSVTWACLCLFVVHAIALVMAVRGIRQATPVLLLSLSLMTFVAVIDNVAMARLMAQFGWSPTDSVASLWGATQGLRWSVWLAFNGWFFLRLRPQ